MTLLTIYGAVAVSIMLLSYALEARSRWWVLVFAFACAASSGYGWLSGTWPFGVVEGIWALVALRRWWRLRTIPVELTEKKVINVLLKSCFHTEKLNCSPLTPINHASH